MIFSELRYGRENKSGGSLDGYGGAGGTPLYG
jgi:hypothetical protein